ncbi:MAG: hypothetical protein ABR529_04675 [Actinomycetota bacterium]
MIAESQAASRRKGIKLHLQGGAAGVAVARRPRPTTGAMQVRAAAATEETLPVRRSRAFGPGGACRRGCAPTVAWDIGLKGPERHEDNATATATPPGGPDGRSGPFSVPRRPTVRGTKGDRERVFP